MFNPTFNSISVILCQSVLLVENTVVPGLNRRPVASHWQTLSHKIVSCTPRHERYSKFSCDRVKVKVMMLNASFNNISVISIRTGDICSDCTYSCKSNYHIYDYNQWPNSDILLSLPMIHATSFQIINMSSNLGFRVTVTLATQGVIWTRCGFWITLKI